MDDDHWTQVGYGGNCPTIGFLDMDAFELQKYLLEKYGKVEGRRKYLELPCILKHPMTPRIISVNYVAKYEYGISKEDTADEALWKCPDLEVVKKDAITIVAGDLPTDVLQKAECRLLREASQDVIDSFVDFRAERGLKVTLEKASNDETFFDLTEEVDRRLADPQRYPINQMSIGANSHLEGNQKFKCKAIAFRYHKIYPRDSGKYAAEARLVVAATILEEFRINLFKKTDMEASGGIAFNMLLAKLACPLHKPGGMTILPNTGFPRIAKRISVDKLPGLGEQGPFLSKLFGHGDGDGSKLTIHDLSLIPTRLLKSKTGWHLDDCHRYHQLSRGSSEKKVVEKLLNDSISVGISNLRSNRIWVSQTKKLRIVVRELLLELIELLSFEQWKNKRKANGLRFEVELSPRGQRRTRNNPKRGFTMNSPKILQMLSQPEEISEEDIIGILNIFTQRYQQHVLQEFKIAMIMKINLKVPSFSFY